MGALKNDKKDMKPAMQFVHPDVILGIGNAMAAGEIKYKSWNFLKGHGRLQLCSAIIRHTCAIMRGEDVDRETSELLGRDVYHWDCIGANVNMLVWQRDYGTLKEDRPTNPTQLELAEEGPYDPDTVKIGDWIEPGDAWKRRYKNELSVEGPYEVTEVDSYSYDNGLSVRFKSGKDKYSRTVGEEFKIIRRAE